MEEKRAKFRNESSGRCGVIKIDARGERKALSVAPGEEVWLTQQEIIETAEAPRQAKDSPFEPQRVEVLDDETGQIVRNSDGTAVYRTVPAALQQLTEGRPVPTTRTIPHVPSIGGEPAAEPAPAAEGKNTPGEELGTPEAKEIAQGGRTMKGAKGGDIFVPEGVVLGETPGWPVDADSGLPLELTDAARAKLVDKQLEKVAAAAT